MDGLAGDPARTRYAGEAPRRGRSQQDECGAERSRHAVALEPGRRGSRDGRDHARDDQRDEDHVRQREQPDDPGKQQDHAHQQPCGEARVAQPARRREEPESSLGSISTKSSVARGPPRPGAGVGGRESSADPLHGCAPNHSPLMDRLTYIGHATTLLRLGGRRGPHRSGAAGVAGPAATPGADAPPELPKIADAGADLAPAPRPPRPPLAASRPARAPRWWSPRGAAGWSRRPGADGSGRSAGARRSRSMVSR